MASKSKKKGQVLSTIQALSPIPFNARREVLIIGFAYHSLLKLDKSGKTQISPSRPWQANQRKKRQVLSTIQALSPIPFNARREALIIGFAYHSLLKLDKSGGSKTFFARDFATFKHHAPPLNTATRQHQ